MTQRDEYLQLKQKYIQMKTQSGGGTWGVYSYDNDGTQDYMIQYFKNYDKESNQFVYNSSKEISNGLDKIFSEYEDEIKKSGKINLKNIYLSQSYKNANILGIVIELILEGKKIAKKYLLASLVIAYREYILTYSLGNLLGWRNLDSRKAALVNEIKLLNCAINNGTPLLVPNHDYSKSLDNLKKYLVYMKRGKWDFFDHHYIKIGKKTQKEFLPYLNANIVIPGTIMTGFKNKYGKSSPTLYISVNENDNNKWREYDSFREMSGLYYPNSELKTIYGKKIKYQ